jgi:hypothetical protein
VFLVSGNHDIDHKSSIKDERRVTPEVFESLYGAMNFDFIFNNCLFIICGVDLKNPVDFLNYLRETLSKKGEGKSYIFVFIHYPPKGLAEHIKGALPIPNEEDFFSLLETHNVTACFFGDYHGHWRGQRKGVNLIVSGGGGRLKPSQPEWGKFHHILKITVEQQKFFEEVITIQKQMGWEDDFEEWIFVHLFPLIENSFHLLYFLFASFLALTVYLLLELIKAVRKG